MDFRVDEPARLTVRDFRLTSCEKVAEKGVGSDSV